MSMMIVGAAAWRRPAGGGGPVAPAKYWRVLVTKSTTNSYVAAQEIEMATALGGPNLCVGGAPIYSSFLNPYTPARAFDGNRAGAVDQCWVSGSTTMPHWIGYNFSSPLAIRSLRWVRRTWSGGATQSPQDLAIQSADDLAGPWTTVFSVAGLDSSQWSVAGMVKEFTW